MKLWTMKLIKPRDLNQGFAVYEDVWEKSERNIQICININILENRRPFITPIWSQGKRSNYRTQKYPHTIVPSHLKKPIGKKLFFNITNVYSHI